MHRMMGPIPLFQGSRLANNRFTAFGQSATLTAKEKKYMSNVEKALQSFESVEEWADYIAFLAKLQKSLHTNPDKENTNWIPYDFQVSIMLSKCLAPSLPSGVHKKTIELYSNIFDILKETNLSQSITLWLPGIFPLMSYASISIKQDLLNLFSNYICNVEPIYLRSCFKSILLSLLPALDDTTSEFFNPTIDLIEKLKIQLDDVNHFWQCILLSIITSPDKRTGSMEYLTRKFPLFKVLGGTENLNKDIVLGELSLDAKACLTPNSSLLVRAFCRAISDDNLFVQRGFFDILLSRLPLNSAVFQYLINDDDKELLLLHVTSTVMKKDMSLNRRLWNWLLGPEPSVEENQSDSTPRTLSRSEYFKKYGYQPILKTLKQLLLNDTDKPKSSGEITQDFITVCSISISIMDRWEIGQMLLPQLFVSILERSKHIFEHQPSDFEKIIKVSNELFDGVETNIIWANIFELIRNNQLDLVLFILRYYNVEDEEMLITHIPMVLLGSFAMFKLDIKWICLVETLIKMIPERALLPFELTQEEIDLNDEYKKSIVDNLNEYYSLDDTKTQSSPKRPYENLQLSSLYFTFITDIIIRCLDDKQSTVFLRSCKIFESFMQIVPSSKEISNLSMVKDLLMKMGREMENDVELSFGASTLFKYIAKDMNKLEMMQLLKIIVQSLWSILGDTEGLYQVEAVERLWNLEMIVGSSYLEGAICELLLESEFEKRVHDFNVIWTHLNNDRHESFSILKKPLYLILEELENDVYISNIAKWIKSTNNSGTLNKIFRIICMELFSNEILHETAELIDFDKISYDLQIIHNLLKLDNDILNNFKFELCVIDNNKQLQFIRSNKWDFSTYKSFMIIVLNKFLDTKITSGDASELKYLRMSLKLLNLLIDGTEPNFNSIFISLIENCQKNCLSESNLQKSAINSYYLETIVKMVKLSSKNKTQGDSIFENEKDNEASINLLQFIVTGIKSSKNNLDFSNWVDLILSVAEYYPDLIFQIVGGLVECICGRIDDDFIPQIGQSSDAYNESLCELIIGLEKILMKCHKYLGYILSDTFGFNNVSLSHNNTVKDSGFFGSVIQGVFQVEGTEEKNEGTKMKRYLLETFRRSVSTIYKAWIVLQNEKNTLREVTNPSDGKTKRYWFSKVKFRCRKILEQEYLMEPLETIESLIENWKDSEWGQDDGFKLFQVLDDCQQKIILMYIIQGIISRVNYSSLEEDKRSNLICNLSEIELSNFLVSYITNLRDDENIEKSWNELQGFFKDVLSNVSYYKYIYPQLLEFVSIVSLKYLNTTVGSQKKASREIGDLFIRFLGNVLSIKLVPNSTHSFSRAILHGSLEVNDKEEKDKVETDGNLKEKIVFRQEVCSSLRNVIPSMKILINDDDKLVSAFTNIITCVSTFMNKSGGINFKVPEYFIDLLLQLGADETCKDLKAWKNLCYEILNDGKLFINEEVLEREKWDSILQTWIRNDDSRLRDLIVHKQTINMNKGNSGILFNWNDEVAVLNGNIEYIKKITYLLLINEKDTFLNLINDLLIRIDGYLRTFQNLSKHCEAEIWIFILIRCIVVKFSENHLIESWTMINSSIFQILSEGYQKIVQVKDCGNVLVELEVEEEDENVGVFNQVFLEACKLLDILVVINYEEFQLSEWVFICDNMDGIYNNPGQQVGILEKLSKNSVLISGSGELTIDNKGVPMLKNIVKIKSLIDMKRFFGMLKIEKFENDYEMRDIKYDAITQDILHDLLSI